MMDTVRLGRRLARAALGRDIAYRAEIRQPTVRCGSEYGGWNVYARNLSERSIAYSFGVGNDVSFDLALISQFGMTVHAFDPTPGAIEWVARQELPKSFRFYPIGIADYDGTATFNAPRHPGFVSYTLAEGEGDPFQSVAADVRRLATIMSGLEHDHIDLLKLDVEGAEYSAFLDILSSNIDVRQILVEFHHRFRSISISRTQEAVELLRKHGFLLFSVSPRGEEFSFVRADQI